MAAGDPLCPALSPDGLRWEHTPGPIFRFQLRPGTADLGPVAMRSR